MWYVRLFIQQPRSLQVDIWQWHIGIMQPVNTCPTKPEKGAHLMSPALYHLLTREELVSSYLHDKTPLANLKPAVGVGKWQVSIWCASEVNTTAQHQNAVARWCFKPEHILMDILRKGCVCECFDLIMPRNNSSRAAVFLYGRAFYVTYIQQEFYQSCNSPWYLKNFYM